MSEILGHSAIHITLDLYTHVNEGVQRHALEALEELIGGQLGRQELESSADEDAGDRREAETRRWRRRTGIEPARPAGPVSTVLKN